MNKGSIACRRVIAATSALLALAGTASAAPFIDQGTGLGAPAESSSIGSASISLPGNVTAVRNNFLSGLASHQTETFGAGGFNPAAILGGNGSITSDDNGAFLAGFPTEDSPFFGRWDTSNAAQNSSGGWFENGEATQVIEVLLNVQTPRDAVGFLLTDYGDFGASIDIELFDGANSLGRQTIGGASTDNASVTFFGLYSSAAFTSFKLHILQTQDPTGAGQLNPRDLIGIDDLTVGLQNRGTAIPEPGTLALVGLGLLVACGQVKRRVTG